MIFSITAEGLTWPDICFVGGHALFVAAISLSMVIQHTIMAGEEKALLPYKDGVVGSDVAHVRSTQVLKH